MRDIVYTVGYFYDGPRAGVADYKGSPHLYECQFSEEEDEFTDIYRLSKIDDSLFKLALEDWAIFRKWKIAFDKGDTNSTTHPALPEDKNRHKEIQNILVPKLKINSENHVIVKGNFISIKDIYMGYEVEWLYSI